MPATKVQKRFTNKAPKPIVEDDDVPAVGKPGKVKKARTSDPVTTKTALTDKMVKGALSNESFIDTDGSPLLRGKQMVVKTSTLKPNAWNYNEQSDFVFGKLKESLKEFGFTEPITVRSSNEKGPLGHYEIIGGEHRWKAATDLGMKNVPINDIGMMPDHSLKKFMIVLNETKGRPNNEQMANVMAELSNSGVDLSVLPFDEAEIQSLVGMGDYSWEDTSVPLDSDVGNADGESEDEEEDTYDGIYDVLGIADLSRDLDEVLANRLKGVMLNAKTSASRPYMVLNRLIDEFYKSTKLKEPSVEKVQDIPDEDVIEDDEDDEVEEKPKKGNRK